MNWIKNIFAKLAVSKIEKAIGGNMLSKIRTWAQGKKSYIVIGVGVIAAGLQTIYGIQIPEYVYIALGSLLGVTLKAGQSRVEDATKELLSALKEAKKAQ